MLLHCGFFVHFPALSEVNRFALQQHLELLSKLQDKLKVLLGDGEV